MKKLVKIIIPLMLAITSFIPAGIALAAGTEIYYDDGEDDGMALGGLGVTYIVRFTPPSIPVTLAEVKVYCTGGSSFPEIPPGHGFKVHVFNENKQSVYGQYYEVTQGWNTIDLSTESLPVIESDFYVGFELVENYYPCIGVDRDSTNNDRSYKAGIPTGPFTLQSSNTNYMIRAVVETEVNKVDSVIDVDIDIKPHSDPNSVNLNSKGVIPVAILSSETFDASMIDPATVMMEGMAVKKVGKKNKFLANIEDVNGDGYSDLIVKIEDQDSKISQGTTTVTITGELSDGTPFVGCDEINIVPAE
ncbi:MAG: hypothetical protein JSU79_09695 [Dehalococcoidales bacterium]|nr:MAG: hypothetical protein JSU79_09695 [Dehalococcoidales bacterium]